METVTDSKSLTFTVCRLVAYLVANIVKDEKEYRDWGFPFITLSVEAQFGKEECTVILEELNAKFCPLIGHGLSLILEENETEDYTLVHSAEILLSSILNETDTTNVDFDNVLKQYMDNFFQFVLNSQSDDMYDARIRVIARRMCDALNLTASEFSELESLHWRSSTTASSEEISIPNDASDMETDSHSLHRKRFHEKFNHDCKAVPRSSILASFRIWRVAFIAAGGGALMALSGVFAAPAIMNTVLPLICASETVAQVSVALTTALNCIGITSLELIPGIMSSYGAAVAGTKMLHRTAPLRDFSLKPLHLDVSERKEQLQQLTRSVSTTHSEDKVNNSNSAGFIAPALQRSYIDCVDATGKHLAEQEGKGHVPVFILVSGHLERGLDARQLWGASGFAQAVVHSTENIVAGVASVLALHETKQTVVAEGKESAEQDVPASATDSSTTLNVPAATTTYTESAVANTTVLSATTDNVTKQGEDSGEPLTDWEELTAQVSGWWRENITTGEEYVLQWEPSMLEDLHESLRKILINKMLGKLKGMVKGEILKFTPIPAFRAAATLPLMVMDKINELDDPWVIAMDRAHQAGKLLARVLLAEHRRSRTAQTASSSSSTTTSLGMSTLWSSSAGKVASGAGSGGGMARVMGRPITLVGYGMGARLIFHCLETLAAEGGTEARGIVENAVLIGTPVGMEHNKWRAARSVVAGRLVNCYAWNDWMLALLYRSKSYEIGVAGLYPIHLHSGAGLSGAKSTTYTATAKQSTIPVAATTTGADTGGEEVEMKVITAEEHFTAMIKSEDSDNNPTLSTAEASVTANTAPTVPRFVVRPGGTAFEVENCDVSHLISSHTDYPNVLPAIITMLQL